MDQWTHGWTDEQVDGWMDRWTDRGTDEQTDERMDIPFYRDALTHLKTMQMNFFKNLVSSKLG